MLPNLWKPVLISAILLLVPAIAAAQADQQSYCAYVMEQAQAQRDLLRTPTAAVGVTQPETGLPVQTVAGASLGLSDFRKSGLTMDAARKNCNLYKATTAAQQTEQYAATSLEKEALSNRLVLIDHASKSLDDLIQKTSQMISAQNATNQMLFSLQTTRIKLDADRADTQLKISALYAPPLNEKPLKELIMEKQMDEATEQKALDKIDRQNNWDVALSVGVHQQVNPVMQGPQSYGAVTITYNLGSHAIDKHLDRAAEDYDAWKNVQEGDIVRGMEVLRQQLADGISVQESKLASLRDESSQIEKDLQLVANPDTSAAFDFHNQLASAQLLLQIESGDASFRIQRLREFIARNF
jgi:hypothetical protein